MVYANTFLIFQNNELMISVEMELAVICIHVDFFRDGSGDIPGWFENTLLQAQTSHQKGHFPKVMGHFWYYFCF